MFFSSSALSKIQLSDRNPISVTTGLMLVQYKIIGVTSDLGFETITTSADVGFGITRAQFDICKMLQRRKFRHRDHFLQLPVKYWTFFVRRGHSLVLFLSNAFPNKNWNMAFGENVRAKATALSTQWGLVCLPLLRNAPFLVEKSDNWSLPFERHQNRFSFNHVVRFGFSFVFLTFIEPYSMPSTEFSTWDQKDMIFAIWIIRVV